MIEGEINNLHGVVAGVLEQDPACAGNRGYSDLIGPRGPVPSDAFALGVLLLGPHTNYPPHTHPALEIYEVHGGTAEWWRGHPDTPAALTGNTRRGGTGPSSPIWRGRER